MSEINEPAFPCADHDIEAGHYEGRYEIRKEFPGMSIRQYAAIKLRVPDSGTPWLDAMIEESLRNDFAGRAMQGLLASGDGPYFGTVAAPEDPWPWYAKQAYTAADALLAARQARSTETSGSVQAKEPTP